MVPLELAAAGERAHRTTGLRAANLCTQVEECPIYGARASTVNHGRGDANDVRILSKFAMLGGNSEDPADDARNVYVESGHAKSKSETGNGSCGVRSNTGELEKPCDGPWSTSCFCQGSS